MKKQVISIVLATGLAVTSGGWAVSYDTNQELSKVVEDKNKVINKKSTKIANLEDVVVEKDNDLKANGLVIDKQKNQINKQKKKNKSLKIKNETLKNKNETLREKNERLEKELAEANFKKSQKGSDVVGKHVNKSTKTESKDKSKTETKSSSSQGYNSTALVTAYTAGAESTGKSAGDSGYGLTASGTTVTEGRTISCSKDIPFGTVIDIEGIGSRVCEDTGRDITSGRIDLYIADLNRARSFGKKTLKINIRR